MKYHIHIPKLLEFALNVVCDDVTLHGKNCLITPIPYPLYLRCIMTYADKYDARRYSTYRFYREVRSNVDVNVQIGRLYPNVLDHVVLDDDVDIDTITYVTQSPFTEDAISSIQRFMSRYVAAGKGMSQILNGIEMRPLPRALIDVLLSHGVKLDPNHENYFNHACLFAMIEIVLECIDKGADVDDLAMTCAIESGNCEIMEIALKAYRGRRGWGLLNVISATVQSLELCLSLNILQSKKHYRFMNIPSFSVLQWILDHDVMEHDQMLIDIASNAARYSGHYFDMLRYLIEQRSFTVPRDTLIKLMSWQATDLDVFDYLLQHGADVNAVEYGQNVLEHFPMLIRYWIDRGFVSKTFDQRSIVQASSHGMTCIVLELMKKYAIPE